MIYVKVRGDNGLEFELTDTVATGMIAAGIVAAVDEPGEEPEVEPVKTTRSQRAK